MVKMNEICKNNEYKLIFVFLIAILYLKEEEDDICYYNSMLQIICHIKTK